MADITESIVDFAAGSRVERQPSGSSGLPIFRNGVPGTYVYFADGSRVPLPTDQIVSAESTGGFASVGFGGMRFVGIEANQLVFERIHDLAPEEELSPERGRRMTLEQWMVTRVRTAVGVVWNGNGNGVMH